MSSLYQLTKASITDAILALNTSEKPNIAKITREFNVPVQRLRNRWHGRAPIATYNKALTEEQELAVY